jgi:hypothetical protein
MESSIKYWITVDKEKCKLEENRLIIITAMGTSQKEDRDGGT